MGTCDVQAVIAEVELLLNEEELTDHIELAIEKLLNVVETLSADKKALADEVDRICKKLGEKNKKPPQILKTKQMAMTKSPTRITRPKNGDANAVRSCSKNAGIVARSKTSPCTTPSSVR